MQRKDHSNGKHTSDWGQHEFTIQIESLLDPHPPLMLLHGGRILQELAGAQKVALSAVRYEKHRIGE